MLFVADNSLSTDLQKVLLSLINFTARDDNYVNMLTYKLPVRTSRTTARKTPR